MGRVRWTRGGFAAHVEPALTRDERLRKQARDVWKRWKATVLADELPAIEDAVRRGVAAPAALQDRAAEAARLKLGRADGLPDHESEYGRQRGFAIAIALGGLVIVLVALVASSLAPGLPVPSAVVAGTWVVLGPILYWWAREREKTVERALRLNSGGDPSQDLDQAIDPPDMTVAPRD